jgi:hypothetical protein
VTTTTVVRQLSMHNVSNGRPWPAIRFLILFQLPSATLRRKEPATAHDRGLELAVRC